MGKRNNVFYLYLLYEPEFNEKQKKKNKLRIRFLTPPN